MQNHTDSILRLHRKVSVCNEQRYEKGSETTRGEKKSLQVSLVF